MRHCLLAATRKTGGEQELALWPLLSTRLRGIAAHQNLVQTVLVSSLRGHSGDEQDGQGAMVEPHLMPEAFQFTHPFLQNLLC